jgi:Alginate export
MLHTRLAWMAIFAVAGVVTAQQRTPMDLPPAAPIQVVEQSPVMEVVEHAKPAEPASHEEQTHKPMDWSKVPPIIGVPRNGWFGIKNSGPGYYSALDLLRGQYREKAPPAPFGTSGSDATPLYDHDFRYLDKPDNTYHLWSDFYKRVHLGDDFLFNTGGELRYRFNNYGNSQASGRDDRFDLFRLRTYGDLWYKDEVRLYAEFINAQVYNGTLPPASSDVTGPDLLNAFLELKAAELGGSPVMIRGGRQELVLGSQRLIASPDFSNTLRTYDGVRAYWHSSKWDANLFWVRPVTPNARRFDSSDGQRAFSGAFATHRPTSSTLIDAYLLNLNDTRAATKGDITTFGGRFAGDVKSKLLFDFEAAHQTGTSGSRTVSAQMATAGLGWHFARLPWNINFWTYFDYASGTQDPASSNVSRTFNQLFSAGHTYFGAIDVVGRQNIQDLNFQLELNPTKWIQFKTQYHIFKLSATRDALYNSGGTAIRRDPTGAAGRDVGNEIDFLANFHLTARQDLLVGYSRLFAGNFLKATGPGADLDYFFAQYTFRW